MKTNTHTYSCTYAFTSAHTSTQILTYAHACSHLHKQTQTLHKHTTHTHMHIYALTLVHTLQNCVHGYVFNSLCVSERAREHVLGVHVRARVYVCIGACACVHARVYAPVCDMETRKQNYTK